MLLPSYAFLIHTAKGRFPLQPYRTETYLISLFPSTNGFDTKENTTVRYDTIEVETGLNSIKVVPRQRERSNISLLADVLISHAK